MGFACHKTQFNSRFTNIILRIFILLSKSINYVPSLYILCENSTCY